MSEARARSGALLRARLAVSWAGWLVAFSVLKRFLPLSSVLALARGVQPRSGARESAAHWLACLHGSPRVLRYTNCLDRSLATYRLLVEHGVGAHLSLGMKKEGRRWLSHAWVTVDGKLFGEPPSPLDGFSPVLVVDTVDRP